MTRVGPLSPRTVLIVGDPFVRGTLSATRSLGAQGHRVIVGAPERGHAARSRQCAKFVRTPPATAPDELVDHLAGVVAREGVEVVVPGDDEHLLVLSEARDELSPALFPYAAHDTVLRALDKLRLYETAQRLGIVVPEFTLSPPDAAEQDEWIAKARLHRPGIPHQHFLAHDQPSTPPQELIYQRLVHGHLLAVIALRSQDGRTMHLGTQVADKVYPEPFGVSTRARVQPVDPGTASSTERILTDLGWWGIAQLQFIAPPVGPPALIDFNGRFFGSLALTAATGVDLPSAWVASTFGEELPLPEPDATARYQWLEGDLRRATSRGRRGRLRDVAQSLRYAAGASHSLFRLDDPGPAASHLVDLAGRVVRAGAR